MAVEASKLRIVIYPDPVLRTRAKPIPQITDEVRAVARRMLELMNEEEGVGLAAPQVGLSWRMFVTFDPSDDAEGAGLVYINPTLKLSGEFDVHEEGCLSVPGVRADIRRPSIVDLTATDLEGRTFTARDDDFLARVWQHENDHLDGVMIIDKLNPLDRLAKRKAIKSLEAAAGRTAR